MICVSVRGRITTRICLLIRVIMKHALTIFRTLVSALRFEVELFRNQTSSGIKIYTGVKTEFFKIDIQQGVWNLLTVRVGLHIPHKYYCLLVVR